MAKAVKLGAMKTVYLFPGQGSQAVGMGKALAEAFPVAKEVFQEVDDTLGQHLSKLMFDGPESDLTLTENTQPAIMACSIAALRVMEKEVGVDVASDVAYVAGHSLGEYAALVCARALTVSQAAMLLRTRGQAMQQAVSVGEGAMAAIIGLNIDQVQALCKSVAANGDVCEVANYNSEQQIVISGAKNAIDAAIEQAKEAGAKRALSLPVSAPFHCSLMQPAAERMREALDAAQVNDAAIPVIANMTAQPVQEAGTMRDLLVQQVTGMVRWQETMEWLNAQAVEHYVELGHGKVLTGLGKRAAPDAQFSQVGAAEDIDALANAA